MAGGWLESGAGRRLGALKNMMGSEIAEGSHRAGAARGDRPGVLFLNNGNKGGTQESPRVLIWVAGRKMVSTGIQG